MTTLCQITMNAGDDIPGSVIKWNLKENADKFERVIVVDGNLTEQAKEFYSQFENLEWVDSPWEDSYVKQYEAWKSKLAENDEAVLYLDCDEVPSVGLMQEINFEANVDIYRVPCVLHITEDGKKYYPVEPEPKWVYEGQWTKNILIFNHNKIWFRYFGSHVIPEANSYSYTRFPYYHMKSLESFVYNDVWQAFLHPTGQRYTPTEAAQFKLFTTKYKTIKEFKAATEEGEWPLPLQRFAWLNRWSVGRPISRLAWTYFLLCNHMKLEEDEGFTWERVKKHVLGEESMKLLEKNKLEGNYIYVPSQE